MRQVVFLLVLCATQLFSSGAVWAQTYTTTGASTNWNDASAWVKTNPEECTSQNSSLTPPKTLNSGNSCPVNIIINHPIEISGNTTFGGGYMKSLTINANGSLQVTGSVSIYNVGNKVGPFAFTLLDGGAMTVSETFTLQNGATLTLQSTDPSSTSSVSGPVPSSVLSVKNLTFGNSGDGSTVIVGENTEINVTEDTNINAKSSSLQIQGNFTTGLDLIVGNSGSDTGDRVSLSGTGSLVVGRDASIKRNIAAIDNSSITIGGNYTQENSGNDNTNTLKISGNVTMDVSGVTTLYKPMYVSGTSQINLSGDLVMPNVNSELIINDDVNFYIGGNTTIQSPVEINNNSFVTFAGNVTLLNVGGSTLTSNDYADILITGDLTMAQYGGALKVLDNSQLLICNDRMPAGTDSGSFPSEDNGNVTIASTAYYGSCRILPVEFLYFNTDYSKTTNSGLLTWSTAKEWENSHFEIERAVNSVEVWETIGRVEGQGYSDIPVTYSFEDTDLPNSGGNVFYRLRQVDFSETFAYSVTRAIQVLSSTYSSNIWSSYPNPSVQGTNVQVKLTQPEQYQDETIYVSLSNSMGESKSYSPSSPEEISSVVSGWLNTSNPGLYILNISWGDQRQQVKMMRN